MKMEIFKQVLANRSGLFGIAILSAIGFMAFAMPLFYTVDPWQSLSRPMLAPGEDMQFVLGTDVLGRDTFAGLINGARISVFIGFAATIIALGVGISVGAIAGYYVGWIDDLLMRTTEMFQTLPTFVLAIVLVALFQPSIYTIILAIALVSWPPVARLVRAEFLTLRKREYVEAARVLGQTDFAIITRQILPNAMSPVIVMSTLMIASAILMESALGFLGLGDANYITWGYMIGASRSVLFDAWWLGFIPGFAILVTVLALNLVGEALSDALNPRLARQGKVL